jgi:hypothetical protein
MNNKIIIESLSMDLLRVALGYHRGSVKMADRFVEEANKRIDEVDQTAIKPYFKKILRRLPEALSQKNVQDIAEDALMYHTLCKNYAEHYC